MFTNYPLWSAEYQWAVVECKPGGAVVPYPDTAMNSWHPGDNGLQKWVCVQAVHVDDSNRLWVVDPASPFQKGVYNNSQKLVQIDLTANAVSGVYPLADVTDNNSYINDVRVDTRSGIAYLTNSSEGGIVIVDLNSGKARQVLQGSPSVMADPNYVLAIDGQELRKKGVLFHSNSDGIALSPDGRYLYYKPLTDDKLYRIRTADLRDTTLTPGQLAAKVVMLGHFATTDGMATDQKGNLYLGDLENHSIVRLDTALNKTVLVSDNRLSWPDSYQVTREGYLYVSCSQIQNEADFHDGKSKRTTPYSIYRIKLP